MYDIIFYPESTYRRTIANEERNYAIFIIPTQHVKYTHHKEIPLEITKDELFAIHDGYGSIDVFVRTDTPF